MHRPCVLALTTLVVVIGAASCRPSQPAATSSPRERPASPLDRAEAFERGAGVARDYARAVQIYENACADGRGDIEACRRLSRAILRGRGTRVDLERAFDIESARCFAGAALGCAYALTLAPGDEHDPRVRRLNEKAESLGLRNVDDRCEEENNLAACDVFLAVQGIGVSRGRKDLREHAENLLCRHDLIDGCAALIEEVSNCAYEGGTAKCVSRQVAKWSMDADSDHLYAYAWLGKRCDLGDAEACAVLPGREIPAKELCAAHDYEACAALGCDGRDPAAAKIAADQGAWANCQAVANRLDPGPEPPEVPALTAAPPLPATPPSPRQPFASLAFRQLAERSFYSGWPSYEIRNLGDRTVARAGIIAYAYDADGALVARSWGDAVRLDLAPGATRTIDDIFNGPTREQLHPVPAAIVSYELCYEMIMFEGDPTVYRTRCPLDRARGHRSDERAQRWLGTAALMPGGAGTADEPFAFDTTLIDAFERANPGTMVELTEGWGGTWRGYGDDDISVTSSLDPERLQHHEGVRPWSVFVPIALTPIAVAYRLDGFNDVRLSPRTLARIIQGDILVWNHPEIARDNPGVALPAVAITVARGTIWKSELDRYLTAAAGRAWRLHTDGPSPSHTRMAGNDRARAHEVKATNGTVTYIDLNVAVSHALTVVRLKNRAGVYIAPSPASATAAAAHVTLGRNNAFDPMNAPGKSAYPFVRATWAIVNSLQTDETRASMIEAYLRYLLTDGQDLLARGHLGRLPPAIAARALSVAQSVKAMLALGAPPTVRSPWDGRPSIEAIDALSALRGRACACRTADCARGLRDEVVATEQMISRDMEKALSLSAEVAACLRRALAAGRR